MPAASGTAGRGSALRGQLPKTLHGDFDVAGMSRIRAFVICMQQQPAGDPPWSRNEAEAARLRIMEDRLKLGAPVRHFHAEGALQPRV